MSMENGEAPAFRSVHGRGFSMAATATASAEEFGPPPLRVPPPEPRETAPPVESLAAPAVESLAAPRDRLAPSAEEIDFNVHVSMRYHARRRAWHDRFHRTMILVITVCASSGVAAIIGGLLTEAEYLAAAVATAGALELTFSFPERARLEDALYRRFTALAVEIASAGTANAEQLHRWDAQRLLIRADADDRLEALRRICHNLEAEARGLDGDAFYRIWPWQRLLAMLVSLPPLPPLRPYGRS